MSYQIYVHCPTYLCKSELVATHFRKSISNDVHYIIFCPKCSFRTKEISQKMFNAVKDDTDAERRDTTLLSLQEKVCQKKNQKD